ncbi:MAG: hypothetical protein COB93_06005 [Sneathiella sp.]|nr:MAG: hypothetical protein COB93_06005 [Sneathiella sp.]
MAFGGLIALAVGLGLSRFVYTPILPFMEIGLGISKSQAGLIASANFLGYLMGAFIAVKETLPGSSRRWFISSLIVCAVTTMAMGWTTSFNLLLVLRVIGGGGSAFVMVFGSALVLKRLAAGKRSGLSALHFAGVGTGIAVSAVLIGGLVSADIGWQGMWIWSGGLSLALVIPIFWLVPPEEETAAIATAASKIRYGRSLKALILSYFLLGFGYIITATFISLLVRQMPHLQWMQSIIWLAVGLAAIPSVALWTWVGARLGNNHSYAIASLLLAIGVAGSVLGQSELTILLSAVLLGGTFMGMTALGLISAHELAADNARQIMAVMAIAFGLGQMIGPTFAGQAYEIYGSFVVPSLIASVGLVIAALLVVFIKEPATGNRIS